MTDDPTEIAESLVAEHGAAKAFEHAMKEALKAQAEDRLYDLSVWREVKRLLRERVEAP